MCEVNINIKRELLCVVLSVEMGVTRPSADPASRQTTPNSVVHQTSVREVGRISGGNYLKNCIHTDCLHNPAIISMEYEHYRLREKHVTICWEV